MLNGVNVNTIIGVSVERARLLLVDEVEPAEVYRTLAPAILAVNEQQPMPQVSPLRDLENLLRLNAGWDPSRLRNSTAASWTAADWGPC